MVDILKIGLLRSSGIHDVGILQRDSSRNVRFIPNESYIDAGPNRPLISASWYFPGDEGRTIDKLRMTEDKVSRFGLLPPWFSNLLPEGALRSMIERGMQAGDISDFDVLGHLGRDLPGAVIVENLGGSEFSGRAGSSHQPRPAAAPSDAYPIEISHSKLRFSLAGVQLKFSSVRKGDRITLPADGEVGQGIVKLANDQYPRLPEIEFSSMRLAEKAGVRTASCELLPVEVAEEIPEKLRPGASVLWVNRFDRGPSGRRTHIEDFSQVLQAVGDQKYTRGNEETIVNVTAKLCDDRARSGHEAVRRIVVNLLLGNTDAHLKNWSFMLDPERTPKGHTGHTAGGPPPRIVLSPAYDIVSIHLLNGDTKMAMQLRGSNDPFRHELKHFERLADRAGLDAASVVRTVEETIDLAATLWPKTLGDLPLTQFDRERLNSWWSNLTLAKRWPSPF